MIAINFPDNLLLSKVKVQNTYKDEKSLEIATGVIKRKYKLAGTPIPQFEMYPFFVLTTEQSACFSYLTVTITPSDYDDMNSKLMPQVCSYLDINKVEVLTKKELLQKMKDDNNKFLYVAHLSDKKYREIKNLRGKIPKCKKHISNQKKTIIDIALSEIDRGEKLAQDLGIS